MNNPYIIAEIASNCFISDDEATNLTNAKDQIVIAKECGADAVKFQFFNSAELYGPECPDWLVAKMKPYEMPYIWLSILSEFCREIDIDFLCSAFSSRGYLLVHPFVKHHKIASPEALSPDIRETVFGLKRPVIISTGCMPPEAIDVLLGQPFRIDMDILMECVSEYPAHYTKYNFVIAVSINSVLGVKWGISDHTKGVVASLYARSHGAVVFEKHVNLVNSGIETPDSKVSMGQTYFKYYVKRIRNQGVMHYSNVKDKAAELYGRQETADGWYRPIPPVDNNPEPVDDKFHYVDGKFVE